VIIMLFRCLMSYVNHINLFQNVLTPTQLSFPSTVVNELEEMVLTLFQRLTVYLLLMLCTQVSKHTVAIYTNGCSSKLDFVACVRIHFIWAIVVENCRNSFQTCSIWRILRTNAKNVTVCEWTVSFCHRSKPWLSLAILHVQGVPAQ